MTSCKFGGRFSNTIGGWLPFLTSGFWFLALLLAGNIICIWNFYGTGARLRVDFLGCVYSDVHFMALIVFFGVR